MEKDYKIFSDINSGQEDLNRSNDLDEKKSCRFKDLDRNTLAHQQFIRGNEPGKSIETLETTDIRNRCSPKSSKQSNCNNWLRTSLSDSDIDDGLEWSRGKQQRRHSFQASKSKRVEMDGYEPEDFFIAGTMDSSQSSLCPTLHNRKEDTEKLYIGQQRKLSSVSVM